MKILQLCTRIPFPPVDGGSIAMYNAEIALRSNKVELKVLSFNTVKQFVNINELNDNYKKLTNIEAVYLDNNINSISAFLNLFSSKSYHVVRFIKKDFNDLLIKTLTKEKFEIIQLESLFMVPYVNTIRKYSSGLIVLRTHNIEHLIWQRMAENATNPLRKWYLNLLAKRLRKFEIKSLNEVDAITTLTVQDEKAVIKLGAIKPVFVSPVGIETKNYLSFNKPDPNTICHIGAMDWLPNQEGILWFLQKVWPVLKNKYPHLKLRLAGKKMPESFFRFADSQCEVNEFVPDAIDFMSRSSIMIVPLFSGSGMRVKIIEGLAMGKAIISTSIGTEGIPAVNKKHLIIADTRDEFIASISLLLENPGILSEIEINAVNFAHSNFDNNEIGKKLINFYNSILLKN